MHNMQTFVADAGHAYSAPYWMGEFGSGGGNDDKWKMIVRFLNETDHDWAYWSIDGYKYPDQSIYSAFIQPFSLEQQTLQARVTAC